MSNHDLSAANIPASIVPESIQQRESLITGKPPRIPPVFSAAAVKAAQDHSSKLLGASAGNSAPVAVADIAEMVITLIGCHPDLYQRVADISIQLLGKGSMKRRDQELVILRVAWLCQAPYEWGEHVRVGKRSGITAEEVEQVTLGSTAPHWNEFDRALLQAAEELHESAMISDATWEVLAKRLDEKQLFELTVLVGQFTLVAYFQNALRFRLVAGNQGLRAR